MSDPYAFWRKALAQKSYAGLPLNENEPQVGFYRMRRRNGGWHAVAIARDGDGDVYALRDGAEVDPAQVWTWCLRYPAISYELYRRIVDEGGTWPSDLPPMIGSNSGEDMPPETQAKSEIQERVDQMRAWLKRLGAITQGDDAEKAGAYLRWLQKAGKKADQAREAEKRPHLEKCREIDAKWKPAVELAKAAAREVDTALTRFLVAQRQRQEEERRRAEEVARQLAQEAQARAAAENKPQPVETPVIVNPALSEPVRVLTDGRAVGLKSVIRVEVSDVDALLAHYAQDSRFRDHVDVRRLLERFAKADLHEGKAVPGAVLVEDHRAA